MITRQLEEKLNLNRIKIPYSFAPAKPLLKPEIDKFDSLDNTIHIFGKLYNYDQIQEEDWHRDIFSGKHFNRSFAKKINIRKDPERSAKCVWEINRLQFLMRQALNYRNTKDEKQLRKFISIVQSWKQANPYLSGVNWYSNIEVNLRLIEWFLCWEVLEADELINNNPAFSDFVKNDWLPLIYQHAVYSYKNPSRFSSANNHLISEYAGLFVAAVKWPFAESEKWIRYAQKGLEEEIIKQHSANGINKEEAAEYIQFITDFFLLAYVVGENAGRPFSQAYREQLHKILSYIYTFLDCAGNFPKYGDEDDGKCFIIDFDESFNNFKSLLTSGAIIFNDPVLKTKSNGFDLKNQVLFGQSGRTIFNTLPDVQVTQQSRLYVDEGHFILRKQEGNSEIYLHMDAAPLGFLSIAAHGHADALSFELNIDGHRVIVDPGTYTYHTDPEWRNYFTSTLAHNSIRINKQNQATFAGSTLWLNHYACTVHEAETDEQRDTIVASHNGYEKSGITHTRKIVFDKEQSTIYITDSVASSNKKDMLLEIPFHFHPDIKISKENEHSFLLSGKMNRQVKIQTDKRLSTKLISGQTNPEIIGWYSDSFMQKKVSNTLYCSLNCEETIQLETIITIH